MSDELLAEKRFAQLELGTTYQVPIYYLYKKDGVRFDLHFFAHDPRCICRTLFKEKSECT